LLPFVLLVSFGVFIILAFQLWGSFFANTKGDAIFYIAEGRSKVLGFGTSEWENLYNGSKVKLGDSVKTLKNAKGVIKFYDGTMLRMDEDTQVTLVDISKKSDYQEILIYLNTGKIWVNKPKQNVIRKTDFLINTNYASYAITGTIFDLEKNSDEILRVVKGQVQVDIIEEADGKSRSIESVPVGIGQQITLNEAVMKEYYDRKSPSVLGVLDPAFQLTDWYLWNIKEDENPTDFTKAGSGILTDGEATPDNSLTDGSDTTDSSDDTATPVEKSALAAPTLTSPKSSSIVTAKDTQALSGKASDGTKKILLRELLAGEETYRKILITSFDPDALTWTYDISATKGNLKAGKNVYEFVGIDESAKETEALKVDIEYQAAEPDLVIDKPAIEKPTITTVDGKAYKDSMTVTRDGFTISGGATGADAMWVDDFKLNKYQPGDATWSYNIKVSYGNLKPGLNSYQVYGVTEDGKKSPILTVKIDYQPPKVEEPAATVSTATTTTATTAPATVTTPVTVGTPEKPLNS
jgi:hypothetical protein